MKKLVFAILWMAIFSTVAQAQKYNQIEKELLFQLSQGNWQYVYDKINDTIQGRTLNEIKTKKHKSTNNKILQGDCNRQAVSRLLLGHAALITGKNNISTKQFYCACDSTGAQSLNNWFSFTAEFEKEYPKSFVSHYLLGDAYARNGKIKEAKAQLDTALSLSSKDVASLNCRAVITWLLCENSPLDDEKLKLKIEAYADIQKGIDLNSHFADLFANEAIFDMRNSGDMSNARKELDKAVQIDSTYYLAQNGLAFSYAEEGEKAKYDDIMKLINRYDSTTPFINSKSKNNDKQDESIRGNMTSMNIGFKFQPAGVLGLDFEANLAMNFDPRGGVYDYLTEGKNLSTIKGDKPVIIGTWFNFNYPNKLLIAKKLK